MASVNSVTLIGNLTADPEVRYLPNGDAVANLRIATNEVWKDRNGEKQEKAEFHKVSFFGKAAETLGQWAKKGGLIYVTGSIQTKKYTDKDGVEKYATDIRGRDFQFLGGRRDGEQSDGNSSSRPAQNQSRSSQGAGPAHADDDFSDIPFNRISNKLAMAA